MKLFLTIFTVLTISGVITVEAGSLFLPVNISINNNGLKNNEMSKEIWKDVKDYEGAYMVSNLGSVKSLERTVKNRTNKVYGRIMKPHKAKRGYLGVQLCINNIKPRVMVHRLVAFAFIPNPLNKPHVNHLDGNPSNNVVANLEWCTPSENELHSYRVLGKVSPSKGRFGKNAMRKKAVNQYSLDGKFIRMFHNMADVKRKLGVCDTLVCKAAKGVQKTAGGFKWEYA